MKTIRRERFAHGRVCLIWIKVWPPYQIKVNVWRISKLNMFLPLYPCILGNPEIHEHRQHPNNENKLTIEKNVVRIFRLFKTKPNTIPRTRTQNQLNYPFNHTVDRSTLDLSSHKRHQTNKPLKIEDEKKETQETQQLFKLLEVVVSICIEGLNGGRDSMEDCQNFRRFKAWRFSQLRHPLYWTTQAPPFVFIYLFIHL